MASSVIEVMVGVSGAEIGVLGVDRWGRDGGDWGGEELGEDEDEEVE